MVKRSFGKSLPSAFYRSPMLARLLYFRSVAGKRTWRVAKRPQRTVRDRRRSGGIGSPGRVGSAKVTLCFRPDRNRSKKNRIGPSGRGKSSVFSSRPYGFSAYSGIGCAHSGYLFRDSFSRMYRVCRCADRGLRTSDFGSVRLLRSSFLRYSQL